MTDTIVRNNDSLIDALEVEMIEKLPPLQCPVSHEFTPGLYIRTIFMPAGALITSRIHKTTHPFVISQGAIKVSIDAENSELLEAPYYGVTKPGTRRVLLSVEDCIWSTFHPLPWITGEEVNLSEEEKMKVVERVDSDILQPYFNNLLGGEVKNNYLTNKSE